jgi:hypothetical protein
MLNIDCNTKEKRIIKVNHKVIGYIENSQFVKPVEGSKHQLKCPPAWAIDAEIFDREVMPNSSEIVIVDKENGNHYVTTTQNFDAKKKPLNRGFGRQYYLPLCFWKLEKPGSEQLSLLVWGGCSC